MPVRLDPLDGPASLLGDGGASLHEVDHSTAAALLARRLGADGVAVAAWRVADGGVVVARSGTTGLRRRRLATLPASALDAPPLTDYLAALDEAAVVGVAVPDPATATAAASVARELGRSDRVWLRSTDLSLLAAVRASDAAVRLVSSVRGGAVPGGIEAHVAAMRDADVDALEMRAPDWTTGHVSLCHRFRRRAWATDAQHAPVVHDLVVMGMDALIGRDVERLVDAGRRAGDASS